jgi:hypothetical protein
MKKLLITAGLLITLCNVGTGVAFAICKCFEDGVLACQAAYCWREGEVCYCSDGSES